MQTPNWLKPGIYGATIGAISLAVVGFTWGGWVTGMKAESMASNRATTEVVTALLPFCVAQSEADPEVTVKLAKLKEASAYRRADVLVQTGWATMPGSTDANRALATACAAKLTDEL